MHLHQLLLFLVDTKINPSALAEKLRNRCCRLGFLLYVHVLSVHLVHLACVAQGIADSN